jgi:cadmium resistance protein CadD (predicted permease)
LQPYISAARAAAEQAGRGARAQRPRGGLEASMGAGGIVAVALTAVVLFAGTNADDIVVLTALSISCRACGRPRRWQIWAGQYAGFAAIIGVSLAAAAGLTLVPPRWLWLLGWVPLGLGLAKLASTVRAHRSGERADPAAASGLGGVIGLTIVNGGDNLSAYIPVFRTSSAAAIAVIVAVFLAGAGVLCLASLRMAGHRMVIQAVRRWGQWAIPVVFILIGLYIFYKTGALPR